MTSFNYSPISPMKALFWSAVINGFCSRPFDGGDYPFGLQKVGDGAPSPHLSQSLC